MNYSYLLIPIVGYSAYIIYGYGKKEFYNYVLGKVNQELDRRLKKEESDEAFRPAEKSKSALIKVNHGGKSHDIYVPYDRSKSSSMLRKKVFLIRDGQKVDLTQKPGIPYLVSAEHLGGTAILIEDLSGEVIKTFDLNQIPGYI